MNTHVLYESRISFSSKVIAKVKFTLDRQTDRQGDSYIPPPPNLRVFIDCRFEPHCMIGWYVDHLRFFHTGLKSYLSMAIPSHLLVKMSHSDF